MRHPLHPALVHFPIACWSLATAADLASLAWGEPAWRFAGVMLLAGIGFSIPAMLAGFVELAKVTEDNPAIKDVNRHMILVMNALALQAGLERAGVPSRVQSAIAMNNVCEPYIRRRAIRHMEKGRVVIFAAGTGNPFFTTDTAAALRAAEMGCDVLMKATQVDGVYSADPKKDPDAIRYDSLSYHDVLARDLKVMDASAISVSRENGIPILVFSLGDSGALAKVLAGQGRATIIEEK